MKEEKEDDHKMEFGLFTDQLFPIHIVCKLQINVVLKEDHLHQSVFYYTESYEIKQ